MQIHGKNVGGYLTCKVFLAPFPSLLTILSPARDSTPSILWPSLLFSPAPPSACAYASHAPHHLLTLFSIAFDLPHRYDLDADGVLEQDQVDDMLASIHTGHIIPTRLVLRQDVLEDAEGNHPSPPPVPSRDGARTVRMLTPPLERVYNAIQSKPPSTCFNRVPFFSPLEQRHRWYQENCAPPSINADV